MNRHRFFFASVLFSCATLFADERSAVAGDFAVERKTDCLAITHGGQPVATYVFRDDKVLRPHFTRVHAPGGIQVTRNHPPVAGQDATDHDTMHPGLWLAFGDINGHDFWRNKAVIKHKRFAEPPAVRDGQLTFATGNTLQTTNGQPICAMTSCIALAKRHCGYLLTWDATFKSDEHDFVFGDQEEMGFGVRVATALTQKNGGVIRNSAGGQGAKATWGRTAVWSDYSGVIGGCRVGVLLMPDPRNFRPSWFHNRDYGLMVANPFGRNAFTKGEKSAVVVKKGEPFRLRFGVLMHAVPPGQDVDLAAEYDHFKRVLPPRS
ncbi:MAG: PmoA family protein [Verrucomicrobia bacterium]|nr:PmoA family protein [Verrucomicrobiota bacterium]